MENESHYSNQVLINITMKNILIQYLWIFLITAFIGVIMVFIYPEKKNRLEFIEEKLKEVEMKKKVLTQKELELEKLATEKEWEQVDKEKDK